MTKETKQIIDALKKYHWSHTWACVTELRNAGYAGEERRIDLWAINCTPSNGMVAHAYEVKTSRGDWLNELKHPTKRRLAMAISNYFWIAASPGVVKPEEVPPLIGLIEVRYNYLDKIIRAEYRDKVRPTWALVAGMYRTFYREELSRPRIPDVTNEI